MIMATSRTGVKHALGRTKRRSQVRIVDDHALVPGGAPMVRDKGTEVKMSQNIHIMQHGKKTMALHNIVNNIMHIHGQPSTTT